MVVKLEVNRNGEWLLIVCYYILVLEIFWNQKMLIYRQFCKNIKIYKIYVLKVGYMEF